MKRLFFRDRAEFLPTALIVVLAAFYLITTLPNLGNDPIVGGDEGWIISASEKLATEGVFGSDLFAGFYRAEELYYFNLPLHHLVLAGWFKVVGVGLTEARLVGVIYGLVCLLFTCLIGRQLGGPWVGTGAAALLVFLRLNLTPFTGLTLTDLGAIVRYDLAVLPFALAAAYLLGRRPDAPSMTVVALAGLLLGLASLTQFIGAFFALPFGLFLLTTAQPWPRRVQQTVLCAAVALLPFLPYFAYIAIDVESFRGQARAVEQETAFLSPSFYIDNLLGEPSRYALSTGLDGLPESPRDLVRRPSARLVMYLIAPLAAVAAGLQAARGSGRHRLLILLLLLLPLQFALFESTKRFVYWVIVVPFLCIAIADLACLALTWRPPKRLQLWAASAVVAMAAVLFLAEGAAVGVKDVIEAPDAADYAALGQKIAEAVPPGARVIGDNRLWLTMREQEHRSLLLLFYFTNPRISREHATDIPGAFRRIDADFLLLSPLTREILEKLTPRDRAAFDAYLAANAELIGVLDYPAYGPIEVFELRR